MGGAELEAVERLPEPEFKAGQVHRIYALLAEFTELCERTTADLEEQRAAFARADLVRVHDLARKICRDAEASADLARAIRFAFEGEVSFDEIEVDPVLVAEVDDLEPADLG